MGTAGGCEYVVVLSWPRAFAARNTKSSVVNPPPLHNRLKSVVLRAGLKTFGNAPI
jgi:hypothetical protein